MYILKQPYLKRKYSRFTLMDRGNFEYENTNSGNYVENLSPIPDLHFGATAIERICAFFSLEKFTIMKN